jgi:hypothetical protein
MKIDKHALHQVLYGGTAGGIPTRVPESSKAPMSTVQPSKLEIVKQNNDIYMGEVQQSLDKDLLKADVRQMETEIPPDKNIYEQFEEGRKKAEQAKAEAEAHNKKPSTVAMRIEAKEVNEIREELLTAFHKMSQENEERANAILTTIITPLLKKLKTLDTSSKDVQTQISIMNFMNDVSVTTSNLRLKFKGSYKTKWKEMDDAEAVVSSVYTSIYRKLKALVKKGELPASVLGASAEIYHLREKLDTKQREFEILAAKQTPSRKEQQEMRDLQLEIDGDEKKVEIALRQELAIADEHNGDAKPVLPAYAPLEDVAHEYDSKDDAFGEVLHKSGVSPLMAAEDVPIHRYKPFIEKLSKEQKQALAAAVEERPELQRGEMTEEQVLTGMLQQTPTKKGGNKYGQQVQYLTAQCVYNPVLQGLSKENERELVRYVTSQYDGDVFEFLLKELDKDTAKTAKTRVSHVLDKARAYNRKHHTIATHSDEEPPSISDSDESVGEAGGIKDIINFKETMKHPNFTAINTLEYKQIKKLLVAILYTEKNKKKDEKLFQKAIVCISILKKRNKLSKTQLAKLMGQLKKRFGTLL